MCMVKVRKMSKNKERKIASNNRIGRFLQQKVI